MKHITSAVLLSVFACLTGCVAGNPAPAYEAEANRTLKFPDVLSQPGGQAKIQLPGLSWVLVWRTEIGFGATDLKCSHCSHELVYNAKTQSLVCPMGVTFRLDGSFQSGAVTEGQKVLPLRAYIVELDNGRLKILG
ncbi:MAG TPA: hypothetical protein VEN81_10020 [Planctomycetota bacterium]|jgi:hypothetical protein|nr:hypothetical protein [Planctomycetota bacterium]